jgi:Protein of unknown function (DUF3352)
VRRLLATAALVSCAAVLAAGCGGDESTGGGLEEALSYVPKDTPFAVAIDTDLDGDQYQAVEEILKRFPGGTSIVDNLEGSIESGDEGVDFGEDVRPLLGNPFVVSATDITSFLDSSEDDDFVAAIQVSDSEALDRLIDKTKPDEQGEVAGATVYEDDGSFFAVEDEMVVFGGSRKLLEAALERADGDDHLTLDTFENSLDGLPEEALARVHFDVQALIAQDPETQEARKVEWVAALDTFGLTIAAQEDAVDVEFNLRSDGEDLSEEDLPLAAGEEAPGVVRLPGEIGFGIRDPRQIVAFFEAAYQAVEPQDFGDYETAKRAIAERYDLDLDKDVFDQLTGELSVSVGLGGAFGARAEVKDPDAFIVTVEKLADALPELGSGLGVTGVSRRGELYEARLASGGSFVFGMSNEVFVVASNPARALELASKEPSDVSGAEGSFVMASDAQQLGLQLVEQLGLASGFAAGLATRPLDELTGSVSTSTGGMKGKFSLTLD